MKKKLCSIVCLCYFVSIMLCACGRKEQGNPIRLPAREDIVSIGVSDSDKYAMSRQDLPGMMKSLKSSHKPRF